MRAPPNVPGWLRPAALAAAAVASYLPAFRAGFVFDDHLFFEWTGAVRGPLSGIWLTADSPDYWPLTSTSFWAEWRLFGPNPAGYHATNVALHAVAAILLWRVLRALRVPGAWLGGLLFAVHPVAVESVAWISERKNTLSGVLFLAALLAWLAAEEEGRARAYAASLALFALALLAKTSVVTMPPLLVALTLVRRGRLDRRDLLRVAPFFGLALAAGAATLWFQRHNAMELLWLPRRGPLERIAGAAWALLFYVQKGLVPVGLASVHAPWPVAPPSPLFYVPLAVVLAGAAVLWRLRAGGARPVVLALGYQALMVLPVLGLVDIAYFDVGPVSNHLQYLALMGPAALGGAALASLGPGRAAAAGAALAAVLAATTFQRATAFEDDLTFWQRAARDAPGSAYARKALATKLASAGRREEAMRELEELARVARDPATRHHARSFWLLFQGRSAEAIEEAREAARLLPSPDLRRHLALQLAVTGRTGEAVSILEPLVREWPRDADYRYWLGRALAGEGRLAEAAAQLREACRLDPDDAAGRAALAEVLARLGGAGR